MPLENTDREVVSARAMKICQNLARLTLYEVIGGQILLPEDNGAHLKPRPLVLLPVVDEPSDSAVEAVTRIGTTFVAVRSTVDGEGRDQIEFTVLLPNNGETERHGRLHAWCDSEHRIFLVPSATADERAATCFQFDRGLRETPQPWTDTADLERGLDVARTMLLAPNGQRANERHD